MAGKKRRQTHEQLQALVEEILTDAFGESEQLESFRQAFADRVAFPFDGFIIGHPEVIVGVDYDGNERRGLTAKIQREGGEYEVALADVGVPDDDPALMIAAYRMWLNLEPFPQERPKKRQRRPKATNDDIDQSKPVELIALVVKQRAIRCRLPDSTRIITLRPTGKHAVPGEILTVQPKKQWTFKGHPYLSGEIREARAGAFELGLEPLHLTPEGDWDPAEDYWRDDGESPEPWEKAIIDAGPRPQFEMEQILPGENLEDLSDPIVDASELRQAGDPEGAEEILAALLETDLRCLDAHAHLGNFSFDLFPREAARHYRIGYEIGSMSLGSDFDGVLPWGLIDNRPFLRCMHGLAVCLWRTEHYPEAEELLSRMLRINPTDNQGSRFLLPAVQARATWESVEDR